MSWSQTGSARALLARVEPFGHAQLLPWEPVGDAIMNGLDRLLASEAESDREQLALVAMDRYMRVTLEPDGRMSLPGNLAHHLDAVALDAVRIVIDTDKLFLWSERIWQAARRNRLRLVLEKLRSVETAADVQFGTPER